MDTIVIVLNRSQYKVADITKFKPHFKPINAMDTNQRIQFANEYKCQRSYKQNPSVELRRNGTIYPFLTIYERLRRIDHQCDLHISVSLPKLLYGHSFQNVYKDNAEQILGTLVKRLADMGIATTKTNLRNGHINTVHFAENILMPTEQHLRMFLSRMSQADIGAWFEKNDRHYSNDGHAVRFHSDIFQIVFYMKYYDLFLAKSRSIDKKRSKQEVDIAIKLKTENRIPPVLRMEVRFAGVRSVTSHFEAVLGINKKRWLFADVLDQNLGLKFLVYYFNKIKEDELNFSLLSTFSNEDICRIVLEKYKEIDFSLVTEALGMFFLLHTLGVKDLREFVKLRKSHATWYRKRRKLVEFIHRYVKPNSEIIDIVLKGLKADSKQLKLLHD